MTWKLKWSENLDQYTVIVEMFALKLIIIVCDFCHLDDYPNLNTNENVSTRNMGIPQKPGFPTAE